MTGTKELPKIHWVVVRTTNFSGWETIVDIRKTRNGAYRACWYQESYDEIGNFIFEVMRSDVAAKKGIL